MSKHLSLSHLLKKNNFPTLTEKKEGKELESLQKKMLRVQQGLFHRGQRAVFAFEGFDAAGKGGAIRRLTEKLDPRGFQVHPIGPPTPVEKGTHWLYRFWMRLPPPGIIAVFDRTWYGRVLVERIDKFAPKPDWKRAYHEINEFEAMLVNDGVTLIKIFLAISEAEQLRRFEARLGDPYKQWKLTPEDVRAHAKWDDYVEAADDMFAHTDRKHCPWHLVPADDKPYARVKVLEIVTERLEEYASWMQEKVAKTERRTLRQSLEEMGMREKDIHCVPPAVPVRDAGGSNDKCVF